MDDFLPRVSVVIAARPDQTEIKAVRAARDLDYPPDQLEILVARGKQPSVQRNVAVRAATGDLILFLDDDSVPPPRNLRLGVAHFKDAKVQMAGGPNLCPPDAPLLERVFSLVLSSWLAFGPSRARYAAVGSVRPSGEKELILCNLLARKQPLLDLGGFNEALYPNEENALMDGLQQAGGVLIYDPGMFVYRRPRPNLKSFVRMLLTYGRGRAEQFRVHPTFGSALNFVPPLFCVYLAAMPALAFLPWMPWGLLYLIPLFFYVLAVVAQAGVLWSGGGKAGPSLMALPLVVLTHLLYGLGFWRGLATKLKPPGQPSNIEVKLERL